MPATKIKQPIAPGALQEPSKGTRDPVRTRRSLLEASYHEFAAHGFHGATVEGICSRAGVSKQTLSHHFGSKEGAHLVGSKEGAHLAVLEHAYVAARLNDSALADEAIPPMEAMHAFVAATFDHLARNRAFVRLQADENINNGRHILKSTILPNIYDPLVRRLDALLDRGVAAQALRPGVDPHQLYISISALCYFYFSNAYTLSAVLKTDLKATEALAARRAHVLDFIVNALRPSSTSEA